MYAEDSVELLQNSGIQFDRCQNTIPICITVITLVQTREGGDRDGGLRGDAAGVRHGAAG